MFLSLDAIEAAATQISEQAPTDDKPAGTIVLLSDGETTEGRPDDEAAAAAKKAGIAVNTIAFGTQNGFVEDPNTGQKVPVPVNEAALAKVARTTGGQTLRAETAQELSTIYENLGRSVAIDVQRQEVTDWFAAVAVLFLALSATGSLLWFGRLP